MHEVECPYCHSMNGDLWEFLPNEIEFYKEECECDNCGKTFLLSRNVDIWYDADPIEEE